MPNDFYDPLLEVAGPVAHEYGISIADALGLLTRSGKNLALVRGALDESRDSEEAQAAAAQGKQFDLAEAARQRLIQTLAARPQGD